MHNLTIAEIAQKLKAKEFSSVEITRHFLDRIKKLDPTYNSFITVTEEHALQQATAADKTLAKRSTEDAPAGQLCGVPYAHKDIFCTKNIKTSCASKMLDNFAPPYDATVTANLKSAGAVMLGKTNMDEFAMGSSNETSYYGAVKNPWDTDCVPGGSSGGSAASVAARLAPAATATDTGGSIRQPASLCGLTGLKPTYGRVSRWGIPPTDVLAWQILSTASSLNRGVFCARLRKALTSRSSSQSRSAERFAFTKSSPCTDRQHPPRERKRKRETKLELDHAQGKTNPR